MPLGIRTLLVSIHFRILDCPKFYSVEIHVGQMVFLDYTDLEYFEQNVLKSVVSLARYLENQASWIKIKLIKKSSHRYKIQYLH